MTDETQIAPGRYLPCSDCRSGIPLRYYVLNERPVCPTCAGSYSRIIRRSTGLAGVRTALMAGGLIGVAGALALAVTAPLSPLRLILFIPIGNLVGRRIRSSLGGCTSRALQWLAVALTYASFSAGLAAAVQREAVANVATAGPLMSPISASVPAGTASSPARVEQGGGNGRAPRGVNPILLVPLGLGLALLVPILAALHAFSGLFSPALAIGALAYGLYQAWKQSDGQGLAYSLQGPFLVGEGPIAPRI